jgi:TRAP-type C4-dicarboxylate transport system permease small subunit
MFSKLTKKFSDIFFCIAGTSIIFMMLLTTADVIARIFKMPIPGTYELICFFNALAIASALGYTTYQKGHISVNLLIRKFSLKTQKTINIITNILSLCFFSLLTWQTFVYAFELKNNGDVSQTLQFPFYYFVLGTGLSFFLMIIVLIHNLLKRFTKADFI